MRRSLTVLALLPAMACVAVAATSTVDRVGPDTGLQVSGRLLKPTGKTTELGNFPAGGALTTNGRFLWTLSAGRGHNDIRIVEAIPALRCKKGNRGRKCRRKRAKRLGRIVQTIPMPGLSGGIAMAPDGRTAYVSGTPESGHDDQKVAADVPGKKGDVIHVLRYDPKKGTATRDGVIEVPPPSDAPIPQDFPPRTSGLSSWPRDLAVSPDGKTLLAALNLADAAAVIDTASRKASYVKTGHYPYGAAITADGKLGLVSNATEGTVSAIDLASKTKREDIQVGPHLSHPQGIAVNPKQPRAYVAMTHQDLVAVIDTETMEVERTISVERREGLGTAPVDLSVTRDGCRLLVADSGEDAIAVFALPQRGCLRYSPRSGRLRRGPRRAPQAYELIGRIPVASYPVEVEATPKGDKLVWIAAKGLGVGPNREGPNPNSPDDSDDRINAFKYLPSIVRGRSGILGFPTDEALRKLTPKASRQLRPRSGRRPPAGTPIAAPGPNRKIEHVFYIVRENRTYDQILGDDARGDGDPKLTLFGEKVTPNAHALAKRFGLLDHVFANSEASIDGHFWTSAASVSDYVSKNWHQNYGARRRPYDFGVYAVTWPATRFLFDQAEKQGISWFNFGEAIAGVVPYFPDKDRGQKETDEVARKAAKSDIGAPTPGCFPNDASAGGVDVVLSAAGPDVEVYDSSLPPGAPPGSLSRFECFSTRFNTQVLQNQVPAFTYITLSNDHTAGTTPGRRTPSAMVAENDWALGQVVDLVSRSPVWSKSLIMVIEDDSQDGADHVDAHRIPAFVISPYAKRGAVIHTRYDFLSFIRTLEIVLGMKPLNLFDALAVPIYDAFESDPVNAQPYTAIRPNVNLTERNTATSPNARLSRRLSLDKTDSVPQRTLDRILWQHVHGPRSEPPPPGPNASGLDERPRGGGE